MNGLDCVLHVPSGYPQSGRPSLDVKNREMNRGYQINIEQGFQTLVGRAPRATLLSLLNELDKHLEAFLMEQKAETIKFIPNKVQANTRTRVEAPIAIQQPKDTTPDYTPYQRQRAQAKREAETRQIETRLGRLPLFLKSSDGVSYTVPLTPRRPEDLPVALQAIKIKLAGTSEGAEYCIESAFERRALESPETTLMGHVNYLAQHMHTMATEAPEHDEAAGGVELAIGSLALAADQKSDNPSLEQTIDDRGHLKLIPRPPEWTMVNHDTGDGSYSDYSDSYDSGDESSSVEEDTIAPDTQPREALSSQSAERGIALSFPLLELCDIELLELVSLSLSVKCTRCKSLTDVSNIGPLTSRHETCSHCTQPFLVNYRSEKMHMHSSRAAYIDLDGCTIADMLLSNFLPTCASCSTTVPSPGVPAVRGSAQAITICRKCHQRLSFKIPQTKFLLVSATHPRILASQRKKPTERLGTTIGTELPKRGCCRHYSKSYRWFRFSCCNKVFACDKCHDEAQDHPNEHANRMICGFCSREQNFHPEHCRECRSTLVGRIRTGFWEGGKGIRDKVRMSRKDPRKYKRRLGSKLRGAQAGGTGGGKKKKSVVKA
ncbi:MAG: hypothetical protein Q9190_006795 [Brigantiaea leucoxantha]